MFHDVNEFFFADRQDEVGMRDNPSLCTLARQIFKFGCFVISNIATIFACTMQLTSFAQ